IARALHHGGALVLLDEPVSQLDPATARSVMALLRQELADGGRAVVAVVHQPELVADFADRELALAGDGTYALREVRR
ncbi:MAG: ABC transporter ATP-binding protein, partial [Planctomycetes bacterium]|nr:ABC transporter ATP-binding protein [Planctomycetota bacterium]